MTFQKILDIAIVLIGVYATLSCVCSFIHEKIASFLSLRGWNLYRGIRALTSDHDFAADIFNHPLIATTSPKPEVEIAKGDANPIGRFMSVVWSKPPSYMDARNFSSALWQVVQTRTATAIAGSAASQSGGAAAPASGAGNAASPEPAAAPDDTTTKLLQAVVAGPDAYIKTLQSSIQNLDAPEQLKQQLVSLLAQGGDKYHDLLAATDGWFNAQMDRVSGWYK